MSKKYVNILHMTDSVPSKIEGLAYPVDALREIYIKSDSQPERIAKRFGISFDRLLQYVKAGEWDRLREEYQSRLVNSILKDRKETFYATLDSDQREQILKQFQRDQNLNEVEDHFRKYGHLWVVDEFGEIVRNPMTNLPMPLYFGSTKEEVLVRRELQANVELNLKLLETSQALEARLQAITAKVEDVTKKLGASAEQYLDNADNDEPTN